MSDDEYKNDYEYTKETLYDLVETGRSGIGEMIEVAKASEHPRAYEVLSKLIKDVADVSDKLMDLNKKHREINSESKNEQNLIASSQTTNNVFIGSTTDLQRMLKDASMKDVTPIEESDGGTEG